MIPGKRRKFFVSAHSARNNTSQLLEKTAITFLGLAEESQENIATAAKKPFTMTMNGIKETTKQRKKNENERVGKNLNFSTIKEEIL